MFNTTLANAPSEKHLIPLPRQGELFVLRRKSIDFQLTVQGRKYTGKGRLFLTTHRLVFVKDGDVSKHHVFSNCEMPLALINGHRLVQPIFGANYFEGTVAPVRHSPTAIADVGNWRITFNDGKCTQFYRIFFPLVREAKSNDGPELCHDIMEQQAFVDPDDPTYIYFTQPIFEDVTFGDARHQLVVDTRNTTSQDVPQQPEPRRLLHLQQQPEYTIPTPSAPPPPDSAAHNPPTHRGLNDDRYYNFDDLNSAPVQNVQTSSDTSRRGGFIETLRRRWKGN